MFSIGKTNEQKAEAEVERRRADPKTYTEPLDYSSDPKMKDFLMDFYKNVLFKKQDEMKALLDQHPKTIGKFYKQLVPSQMENEDFWQRYYYRVRSVDEILKEWGVGGDSEVAQEEAPVPASAKKNRTFSTMELLHQAEERMEKTPVVRGGSLLDESAIEEGVVEEEEEEEGDTFEDASETLPENLGEDGKDKKSSSSSRSSKDSDRKARKSRSDGSRGDDDSGNDSDGGGSVKSAYSYRSTRSARSSKGLSPARDMRRKRSQRRIEDKKKRRDKSPKKEWGSASSPNMNLGRTRSSESLRARRQGLAKPKSDDEDDKSLGSVGSKSGNSSFRVRRQGHVLSSLEDSHADGLAAVQKKANEKWGDKKDSKSKTGEVEKASTDAESKSEEPLLVAFPGRPSFADVPRRQEDEKENPPDKSFFGKIAAMYDPKDPENFKKEDMNASLGLIKYKEEAFVMAQPTAKSSTSGWRTKNSNPYSRSRYRQAEEHEQRCWDICYCLLLTLTLILIGLSIYLLVKPDHAIAMGDSMCSPIAPYQTLTTDRGKIGVAPWWVWPPKNKEFMFTVLCGDERIRTMLVWAPKHKHEKDFRLVIGDVNEEETIMRLNRLDKVEVNGNELKITQDKDAVKDGEPKLPHVIPAAWMKGWEMEDEDVTGVESEERYLISS